MKSTARGKWKKAIFAARVATGRKKSTKKKEEPTTVPDNSGFDFNCVTCGNKIDNPNDELGQFCSEICKTYNEATRRSGFKVATGDASGKKCLVDEATSTLKTLKKAQIDTNKATKAKASKTRSAILNRTGPRNRRSNLGAANSTKTYGKTNTGASSRRVSSKIIGKAKSNAATILSKSA